jgi:hypothetical protein
MHIYVGRKVVCLFCLSWRDVPNHNAPHYVLNIVGKLSMSSGTPCGLVVFRPMVQGYNFEQLCQRNSEK